MRKAAIQSQKSRMSPAYLRAARPGHAMNRRRPMIRASREATRREYVFVASCQGSAVACMVNTSVVPVPGVRHVSRPAIAVATAGRLLGGPGARSTGANGARGGSSGRGPRPRRRERGAVHSEGDKAHNSRQTGQCFGGNDESVAITVREPARCVGPANDYY
jgi:hypothetical protein